LVFPNLEVHAVASNDSSVVPITKPGGAAKPQQSDVGDPFLNQELGIERVLPFSQWSTDGEISRKDRIPLDELVEMRRRDGQARALMRIFVLPILSAFADGEWVEPEDGDAEEETEFANLMWNLPPQAGGMTTSKMVVLKKVLQGITDGFSVFEEVRHVPEEGPLAGKITLRKLAYRDPRTIRFRVDKSGGFNGIRQVAEMGGRTIDVKIPKEKCWFWTCNAEENPFYGVSMFESAYEHYQIKKKLYYIAHLAAQFAAVPGRIGEVPKGADPRYVAAFKQSLANFAFNTSMTVPPDFKVTPFSGNTGFDFLKLIDHHNHMMSKSVLSNFVDNEQRAAVVEIGNTDPNTDFFVMALESIMDDIAEQWSQHLMPKYIDWNFGTKKYPVFKFGPLSDAAKSSIESLFTTVVTSSVLNSTPEFVRELEKKLAKSFDLDIDYDEIEKQEQEAAEEEARKAEEEANSLMNPQDPNDPEAAPQGGAEEIPAPGGGEAPPSPDNAPPVALSNPTVDDVIASAVALLESMPDDGTI